MVSLNSNGGDRPTNRSPLYGLLFAALIMLPVGVSADHHGQPAAPRGDDHTPSWTIEEAVQQAQVLPAVLQPALMATLEIDRGPREMRGTNPDPAAMKPTLFAYRNQL
jgi:hypothetical protein